MTLAERKGKKRGRKPKKAITIEIKKLDNTLEEYLVDVPETSIRRYDNLRVEGVLYSLGDTVHVINYEEALFPFVARIASLKMFKRPSSLAAKSGQTRPGTDSAGGNSEGGSSSKISGQDMGEYLVAVELQW